MPSLQKTKTQVETSSATKVSLALKNPTAADKHVLNMVDRRRPGRLTIRTSVNTHPLPASKV